MKPSKLFALSAMAITFIACTKTEENSVTPTPDIPDKVEITSGQTGIVVSSEGGTEQISFTASSAWTASVDSALDWCSISPESGEAGSNVVTITLAKNESTEERQATIQIKCGLASLSLLISQEPAEIVSKCIVFKSDGISELSLEITGSLSPVLHYSYDGHNWETWDYTSLEIRESKPLYLRGLNPDGLCSYNMAFCQFVLSGDTLSCEGDIMSLLDYNRNISEIPSSYCFYKLFSACSLLTAAPELPATTLAPYCYYSMFEGCTALAVAPELPATTLTEGCYKSMFEDCAALTIAPNLPATTLDLLCYSSMFEGCTALTSAPALPATALAYSCYSDMFSDCTALTLAPELPATTLAELCYNGMFNRCSALEKPPVLPATTLAESCYARMFFGCTALAAAPELPATTLAEGCYANMFHGCTFTTAPELPATTLAEWCYSYMFFGCTELEAAPVLPATTLTEGCYRYMFYGCSKLRYIKCLATDISATICTHQWVKDVASSGTFVKNPDMIHWEEADVYCGIPYGWDVL